MTVRKDRDEIVTLSKKVRQKLLEKGLRKKEQQKIVNQKNREKKIKEQVWFSFYVYKFEIKNSLESKEREARKAEKEEKYARAEEGDNQEEIEPTAPKALNKKRKAKHDIAAENEIKEGQDPQEKKSLKRRNFENITEFDWSLYWKFLNWLIKSKTYIYKEKKSLKILYFISCKILWICRILKWEEADLALKVKLPKVGSGIITRKSFTKWYNLF